MSVTPVPDVIAPLTQALTAAYGQFGLINSQAAQIASLASQLLLAATPTGVTRYFLSSGPVWDQYLVTTDPTMQATIQSNVQRITGYTPFFDPRLTWYPNAWVYFDAYAIYVQVNGAPNPLAILHPDWILRDMQGNPLYIPWGCSNGKCPQYAGDISNPAFRAYQIAQIKSYLAANAATAVGYLGLFLDDVNLLMSVSNGNGQVVAPKDQKTGAAMTSAAWRQYFAEYVEAIRVAFPAVEICHNSVWSTSRDLPADPYVRRQHVAADYINVERGFGDTGITGGTGIWSLSTLMKYIDFVHQLGRAVVIEDYFGADIAYSLPCYYLVHAGRDFYGASDIVPPSWPVSVKLNLGVATSGRYLLNKVWMRDFANGRAYVCEPGAPDATIVLPAPMFDENGNQVSTITLKARTGKLLRSSLQ